MALLAGQSHVFVLAEEGAGNLPQTEVSFEGTDTDTVGGGSADSGTMENNGDGLAQGDEEKDDAEKDDADSTDIEDGESLEEDRNSGDGEGSGNDGKAGDVPEENIEGNVDGRETEMILKEIVPGNDLDEEADIATLADEGVEAYADEADLTYEGIKYVVTKDGEVEVCRQDVGTISDDVVIPETFDRGGVTYQVTGIGKFAFAVCKDLKSVVIPKSVKRIEQGAFSECENLSSAVISDGVISVGPAAFHACGSLESITIPNSVTDIGIQAFMNCKKLASVTFSDNIKYIGEGAFSSCENLVDVKLPKSLENIENDTFLHCSKLAGVTIPKGVKGIGRSAFADTGLESVMIPDGVTNIGEEAFSCCRLKSVEIADSVNNIGKGAFTSCIGLAGVRIPKNVTCLADETFRNCQQLKTMKITITVSPDGNVTPLSVQGQPFESTWNKDSIIFLNERGQELTGPLLEKAKRTYIEAGKNDDDPDDGKWYGWSVGELSETVDTYTVTINVKKDGQLWSDHGRIFALLSNGGDHFLTDLTHVPNGNYRIYDLTGVNPDSYYSRAVDLGVTVTVKDGNTGVVVEVNGGNPEAKDIDYYTVTFYDDTIPYGTETPQGPQIVLNGKTAARPENPKKTDYQFTGWKTTNGGSTPYDFENDNADQAAPRITSIYASWKAGASDTGSGDNPNPGDDSGTGDNSGPEDGSGTGNEEMTVVSEMVSPQAESGADRTSAGDNADIAGDQAAGGTAAGTSGAVAGTPEQAANGTEPETGDTTPVEIYATVAMIAGLTYLLLYFMEEGRGMTEREKDVFVAAFIRWGKKGGAFRRGCAVVAIFCLLAYYHAIGKRVGQNVFMKNM